MTILDLADRSHPVPRSFPVPEPTVPAAGNFDGVHIGHRAILAEAVRCAAAMGAQPAVWTFSSHPFEERLRLLTSRADRLELFAAAGIRYVFLENFEEVRSLSAAAFAEDLLIRQCRAAAVVCGFNFRCGAGGQAGTEQLRETLSVHGVPLRIVPAVLYENEPVSSTRIRAMLEAGNMPAAAACLGRPYSVCLPVLHGKELGRTIGVPTVNQRFAPGMQVPAIGTYASAAAVGDRVYPAVTNVGIRPTVTENDDHLLNAETHLIGFRGDLYGTSVRIAFRFRLRDEIPFSSLSELKAQIARDIARSTSDFSEFSEKGAFFP